MPTQRCTSDGKPGWRWGQAGKCYTYPAGDEAASRAARRRATYQGIAMGDVKVEAVENPTPAQRRDLPDEAFALVKKVDGATRKWLPHHVNTAKSAADDATVDVPRLKAALTRWNQVRGASADEKAAMKAHLMRHARAVLQKYQESQAVAALSDEGVVAALGRLLPDSQLLRLSAGAAAISCALDGGLDAASAVDLMNDPGGDAYYDAVRGIARRVVEGAIELEDGESISDFMDSVRMAVTVRYGSSAWPCEIFSDFVVVSFYGDHPRGGEYYQVSWARDDDGAVALIGDDEEVRRVTSYEPV